MSVASVTYLVRGDIPLVEGAACPCPVRLDHASQRMIPGQGGYVYVIGVWNLVENRLGELVKIGISNNPDARLLQIWARMLQEGVSGIRPFLYMTLRAWNHDELEGICHYELRDKREWGEWFGITPDEGAEKVLDVAKRHKREPRPGSEAELLWNR